MRPSMREIKSDDGFDPLTDLWSKDQPKYYNCPHLKDGKVDELVKTKKAKDGATCRWCEKPVDEWKQGAVDNGEGGMLVRDHCPHCENSQKTHREESAEGCLAVIALMIIVTTAAVLFEMLKK